MAQNWGALPTPAHASDTHFDSPNISYVNRAVRGIAPPARLRFSPPDIQRDPVTRFRRIALQFP